jgi:hypothetical protein
MVAALGNTPTSLPADSDRCRLCETALPADAVKCPRCGLPVRRLTFDSPQVHPSDVLLSVIMAMVAVGLTLPFTISAISMMIMMGTLASSMGDLFLLVCWNGVIIGPPIVIIARRCITRVRKGHFERAWMWRDYWWLQFLSFSPVLGGILALFVFPERIAIFRSLFG